MRTIRPSPGAPVFADELRLAGAAGSTVFEYSGSHSEADANKAANGLMRYVQQRPQRIETPTPVQVSASADSKTCPFCAETIKTAAIVCRFCNRELPRESSGTN